MTDGSTIDRLRHNILFENISDRKFDEIRPNLVERRYSPDEIILEDDAEGEEIYLLIEGRVKIVKNTRFGESKLLALLHAGDFFGELELIDGRPRSARVIAVDNCLVYSIHKNDVESLLRESHPFALRLLQVLSIRLRSSNNHFVSELERSAQRSAAEVKKLERLIEATKVVNSTLDLDKLLKLILNTALKIVDGDRGTIYIVDEERQELWSKVLRGSQHITIRLPMGKGIAGYVAATGDTLNIPDAYLDPRFNPEIDKTTGYRTRTILCMPMKNNDGKIIGVIQMLNKKKGLFHHEDENFIRALSIHAAIAIENARLYEEEKAFHRMREEVRLAAKIQLELLPKEAPNIRGYDIAGHSLPAQLVGGDYFDFIPVDDHRWAICLGDVSGKGLPASLLMANVQATLRGQTLSTASAKDCIIRSNKLLFQSTSPEKFVTLFYGILDTNNHRMLFSNAGHDNPMLLLPSGDFRRLTTGGIVLSIMEFFPFEEESVDIEKGSLLVIYSDGIVEAMNPREELYGEERLATVIRRHASEPASKILDAIMAAAKEYAGSHPQSDDMTLVVIKRVS